MSYCWSLTWLIPAAGLWAFYPEHINYPSSLDLLIAYIFSRCVCAELLFFFVENAVLGVVRSGPLTDRCVLYPLVNVCSNFEKEFLADNVVGASSLVFLWPPNTFCYFILSVANGWQFRLFFFFDGLCFDRFTFSLSVVVLRFYLFILLCHHSTLYPETLLIRQDSRLVLFVNEGSVIVLNRGAGQL